MKILFNARLKGLHYYCVSDRNRNGGNCIRTCCTERVCLEVDPDLWIY